MRRQLARIWLTAAGGGCLALGCQANLWRHSYSEDPLLLSKKSVVGKVDPSGPVRVAQAEPEAPGLPPAALAAASSIPDDNPPAAATTTQGPSGNGIPVEQARPPLSASLASRSGQASGTPVFSTAQRHVSANYGHAPDYSWLQGIVERSPHGPLELRYCDAAVPEKWGGKVRLEDDPRLLPFQDGDELIIIGDLLPYGEPSGNTLPAPYPTYRVLDVRLIHHQP